MRKILASIIIFCGLTAHAYEEVLGDFEHYQSYLLPGPVGSDVYSAWKCRGGKGDNVRIVDFESGWNRSHREFRPPFLDRGYYNNKSEHGTEVWGILAAKDDGVGVTGIVSEAAIGLYGIAPPKDWNIWRQDIVTGLQEMHSFLKPGDIVLLELQAGDGPYLRKTPIEYWDSVFWAIKNLTDAGIIVIEAAGNGGLNLDGENFEGKLNFNVRDSGAIMVGAGSAPVVESAYKVHFSRHITSNFGQRVDVFHYGERVATTGYGDLHLSEDENSDYHDDFGGTSSASAIVAGLVGSLVGIAKAQGKILSPESIREALRNTGLKTHQSVKEPIGRFPQLPELIQYLGLWPCDVGKENHLSSKK
ncbi:MAG: S8 family serine peptidase [Bdellovibrionales bacterium]|nr:S8 family serine peptidase [Bdellovibrionales bacterium]